MANDVLQFVDSIAASPTTRLDLNDGTTWGAQIDDFDFSPPPLRRAINGTLLVDGSVQSASSYDNRVLHLTLELLTSTIDTGATATQNLNRELDREWNYLKYQPNTATAPVFFRTLRSSTNRIVEVPGSGTFRLFQVDILAEPFGYGLREDIAAVTVNNDPAAGSNGLYWDVSSIKGDVAATPVIWDATTTTAYDGALLAVRQHGTVSDLTHFAQCEQMTAGVNTTNPGGAADPVMSGTGTTNYVRTTFGTATMTIRLAWAPVLTTAQRIAQRGTYRVFVVVRRSDNTSVINLSAGSTAFSATTTPVAVPLDTSRQLVDLGLVAIGSYAPATPGRFATTVAVDHKVLNLYAERVSGAGNLDWDYAFLVPADESLLLTDGTGAGAASVIYDGPSEYVYPTDPAAPSGPFAVGSVLSGLSTPPRLAGGFPTLVPNQTNRIFYTQWDKQSSNALAIVKADTASMNVSYWPRYLYIRPATT